MNVLWLLLSLLFASYAIALAECPNHRLYIEDGWVIHDCDCFHQVVQERLKEFRPEVGRDLIRDSEGFYNPGYSQDFYLILWVEIWDRLSTGRNEMWGDVALAKTGPHSDEYVEIRWYDPRTKTKHIVCNSQYVCCTSTKVPLAYISFSFQLTLLESSFHWSGEPCTILSGMPHVGCIAPLGCRYDGRFPEH